MCYISFYQIIVELSILIATKGQATFREESVSKSLSVDIYWYHMLQSIRRLASNINKMLPKVVLVLGPPGSGKGTQCKNIVDTFGYKHLSAGDLLREERAKAGSEYGELIESHIREGKIVPVKITCSLIQKAMDLSGNDKFVIDGFPRNEDNLKGWNENLADNVDLQFMIFFECPLDVCRDRCLGRGAAGSGRTDDNLESLNKRFITYENETKPIIEYYSKKNLVRCIDATKSPEAVFEEVKKLFQNVAAS